MDTEKVHFYDESAKILECFVNSEFTRIIRECRHPFFPMVCASYPRYGGSFQVNIHNLNSEQIEYVLNTLKFYLETEIYPSFDVARAIIVHQFGKHKENKKHISFIECFKLVKDMTDLILLLLKMFNRCSQMFLMRF